VRIAQWRSVPHISTGDILRAAVRAESALGRKVAAVMAAGGLVDDVIITELVDERLRAADTSPGFVLDGFPRSLLQAGALDRMRAPDSFVVALIDVPGEAIVRRLSSRRVCDACGITQSVSHESAGREACPYCGGNLVRRPDDNPDTIRRRLSAYADVSDPVVAYYRARRGFGAVDGLQHADRVTADLQTHIERALNGQQ
jgi:adenylate kinase